MKSGHGSLKRKRTRWGSITSTPAIRALNGPEAAPRYRSMENLTSSAVRGSTEQGRDLELCEQHVTRTSLDSPAQPFLPSARDGENTMDRRLTAGSVARLVDAIEHLPEALVVWDPDDTLVTCNRQYARLFPEPSFVRPGIKFGQLIELNIDTANVRSFGMVTDVRGAPATYRRVRRRAHSAGKGAHSLGMADGRWLQVSERRTDADGVVGIYTDITAVRWTDVFSWLSLVLQGGSRTGTQPSALGPRQEEVLRCVQAGLRNPAIADRLGLADQTVKNHVSRLIRRFAARNRRHLTWLTRPKDAER